MLGVGWSVGGMRNCQVGGEEVRKMNILNVGEGGYGNEDFGS